MPNWSALGGGGGLELEGGEPWATSLCCLHQRPNHKMGRKEELNYFNSMKGCEY